MTAADSVQPEAGEALPHDTEPAPAPSDRPASESEPPAPASPLDAIPLGRAVEAYLLVERIGWSLARDLAGKMGGT